jgi:hypothetical protein
MADAVALAVYAILVGAGVLLVWRRPGAVLYAFIVGLALHNQVMAALYAAGVHGKALTVIQAWKEVLLAVALSRVAADALATRKLPFRPGFVDALSLFFAGFVVVYALAPQGPLDGAAGSRAIVYALRDDLVPVAAFFLGRSLLLRGRDLRRLAWTLVGTGALVAAVGLVEQATVSLDDWARSGVVGWYRHQGFRYHGARNLPENFVFNTGNEQHLVRRLVSTFLSPLGSAYLLVVTLVALGAGALRRPRIAVPVALVCAAGLLFTFTRAALLALAFGLCALAALRRRAWLIGAAVVTVAVTAGWASAFPHVAPRDHWSRADLAYQRHQARLHGGVRGGAASPSEPSLHSHLTNLKAGLRTLRDHPQGFGLGNSGQAAARTGIKIQAGESTYTQLGVDTGVGGMVAFIAWSLALLVGLVRSAERSGRAGSAAAACFAAILAIAVQTDVLGIPWLSYCVWSLAGALLVPAPVSEPALERRPAVSPQTPPAEA